MQYKQWSIAYLKKQENIALHHAEKPAVTSEVIVSFLEQCIYWNNGNFSFV